MFDWNEYREIIKEKEGYRETPYKDHLGWWTVGYGHLIHVERTRSTTVGVLLNHYSNPNMHEVWLESDMKASVDITSRWLEGRLHEFEPAQQMALCEMGYVLGGGVFQFRNMKKSLLEGDFKEAVYHLRDSIWYNDQDPKRVDWIASNIYQEQETTA